ncbi:methyltransferase [Rhodoferax sp.]|uniref:methyltransferase family protein n=1 Tax=Rhodoferax sp. TaxID=50421 RepID=UPI00262C745F|nr:methyltransferase [Rhodoferax sp.]MDD2926681.1 methyltransferase [Rhodoferax sp.]
MTLSPKPLRQPVGVLLVTLQFGLLLWLIALAASQGRFAWGSLALAAGSAAVGGWTLLHNRPGNFNIRPAPKAHGVLVTSGPYRYVRHPMYTAVLLGAAALAWLAGPWLAWALWVALVLVLLVKASLEEQWLREHHSPYPAYCSSCRHRFLPGII